MNPSGAFLCIDIGSQSARASLIDPHGSELIKSQILLNSPSVENPGWAEYSAQEFWSALVQTCQEVSAYAGSNNVNILALGVTCQRATVINLDKDGEVLRPAILWSDRRRCKNVPPVGGFTGLGMKLLGVDDTVKNFQEEAEINWLGTHQPELWNLTHKFVFLSGYLNFRLTGRFKDSAASQVGYVPYDYRKHQWAGKHKWHWRALLPVKKEHLVELVAPGEILGRLSKEAAQQLSLAADLPVVSCATDKACEVLGSGCISSSQACLSFGTAATVNVTQDRYIETDRFVPPYPSAIPAHFLSEIQIYRGFWLVSWFKEEFAQLETQLAEQQSVTTETLLDDLLKQSPPGALGLMAQPYWSPGVRVPGPEARGALFGFTDAHKRAHVYRALLEGLVYALKEGLQRIESRSGTPVSLLRVAGGGSQSDQVMQLTADIFNLPVERNRTYEASSLGVGICCAVATGVYDSFQKAVSQMTGTGREFQPRSGISNQYQQLYDNVYLKAYKRMKPLYKNLMNIDQSDS